MKDLNQISTIKDDSQDSKDKKGSQVDKVAIKHEKSDCKLHNFARRGVCFKCKVQQPRNKMMANDWICKYCKQVNFGATSKYLERCEALRHSNLPKVIYPWCRFCSLINDVTGN